MPAAIARPAAGFFYILSRPRPEYLEEYHEWYNTEHGPLRVKLDFVQNGYRYKCVDPDPSLFMAAYDLSRLAGLEEPEYTVLRSNRSARESEVFDKKLDWIDRRVYKDISSRGSSKGPAPVVIVVALLVRNDMIAEVHRWYEEEHITDLSRVPGWRRTRRFELVEADDLQDGYTGLLAVHDFDRDNGLDGPEHQLAKSRPWRNKIMARVRSRDNKRFEFLHEFRASDYRRP